jgi:hypothetical protein
VQRPQLSNAADKSVHHPRIPLYFACKQVQPGKHIVTNRQQAETLLSQLGNSLGIPQLAFDTRNACLLMFDRVTTVNIVFEPNSAALLLMSYLGPTPNSGGLKAMLAANYLWRATQGSTLALDPTAQSVALIARFESSQLEYERFRSALTVFVDAAEHWRQELVHHGHSFSRDSAELPGRLPPHVLPV